MDIKNFEDFINEIYDETKIYSQYIKDKKVVVKKDYFIFNGKEIPIEKTFQGWFAGDDDSSYTKKAAIYWYIKNRT